MTEGWREVRLADIAEVIVSNVDKKSRTGELPVRLCNYTDVYKNNVVHSKMPLMEATATPAQIEKYGLRSGDIIITKDSESPDDIAVPTIVEEATADLLCGYHLAIVRARDCIDGRFLKYCFEAPQTRVYFKRNANGVTRFGLTVSSIEGATFRIPRLQLQRKIADILRTWDEAIESITNSIKSFRLRREVIRRKLFSEIQYAVKTSYFGSFLRESRLTGSDGVVANKITVKLYGMGAVPKNEVRLGSTRTRYYRRTAGQLIYSKLDFLNGAFAIIPQSLNGYESSLDLPAFDISEQVNPKWLIEYLIRPAYYSSQLHLARGQRKARRIAPDDFLASQIKLPDRKVQDQIASVLTAADEEISSLSRLLDLYICQKRGLLQKLLTGNGRLGSIDTRLPVKW